MRDPGTSQQDRIVGVTYDATTNIATPANEHEWSLVFAAAGLNHRLHRSSDSERDAEVKQWRATWGLR
jgi:hypothetical protein